MEKKQRKKVLICIGVLIALLALAYIFNYQIVIRTLWASDATVIETFEDLFWGETVVLYTRGDYPERSSFIVLQKNHYGIWRLIQRGNCTPDEVVKDSISVFSHSPYIPTMNEERYYGWGVSEKKELNKSVFPLGMAVGMNNPFGQFDIKIMQYSVNGVSINEFMQEHQDKIFK